MQAEEALCVFPLLIFATTLQKRFLFYKTACPYPQPPSWQTAESRAPDAKVCVFPFMYPATDSFNKYLPSA